MDEVSSTMARLRGKVGPETGEWMQDFKVIEGFINKLKEANVPRQPEGAAGAQEQTEPAEEPRKEEDPMDLDGDEDAAGLPDADILAGIFMDCQEPAAAAAARRKLAEHLKTQGRCVRARRQA